MLIGKNILMAIVQAEGDGISDHLSIYLGYLSSANKNPRSLTHKATGRAVVLPLTVHLHNLRVQILLHSRRSVEKEFPQDNALQTHLYWKRARYVLSFCEINRWYQHQDTTDVSFHCIFFFKMIFVQILSDYEVWKSV